MLPPYAVMGFYRVRLNGKGEESRLGSTGDIGRVVGPIVGQGLLFVNDTSPQHFGWIHEDEFEVLDTLRAGEVPPFDE